MTQLQPFLFQCQRSFAFLGVEVYKNVMLSLNTFKQKPKNLWETSNIVRRHSGITVIFAPYILYQKSVVFIKVGGLPLQAQFYALKQNG